MRHSQLYYPTEGGKKEKSGGRGEQRERKKKESAYLRVFSPFFSRCEAQPALKRRRCKSIIVLRQDFGFPFARSSSENRASPLPDTQVLFTDVLLHEHRVSRETYLVHPPRVFVMRRLWASTRCPRELTGRFYDYEGNAPIDGAKRYYLIQSGVLVIQDSYGLRVNEILVDNTLDDSRIIKKGGRVVETQGIIFH